MIDFDFLAALAREAGKAILDVYNTDFEVRRKDDYSPLTLADTRSHRIIADALRSRYPDIPVLSEEGKSVPFETRKTWERFWLVDPLDGTKEFVKRNGEFTVNIALVEKTVPVAGVIYIPVQDRLFFGDIWEGCWEESNGRRRRLKVSEGPPQGAVRIVRSRSHPSPDLERILSLISDHEIVNLGSSIKFCAVARGDADFYPRFGPTWEWDTAAGQAIVTSAGGTMVDFFGRPFLYNKENLLNGPYLVCSNFQWLAGSGVLEKAGEMLRKRD